MTNNKQQFFRYVHPQEPGVARKIFGNQHPLTDHRIYSDPHEKLMVFLHYRNPETIAVLFPSKEEIYIPKSLCGVSSEGPINPTNYVYTYSSTYPINNIDQFYLKLLYFSILNDYKFNNFLANTSKHLSKGVTFNFTIEGFSNVVNQHKSHKVEIKTLTDKDLELIKGVLHIIFDKIFDKYILSPYSYYYLESLNLIKK